MTSKNLNPDNLPTVSFTKHMFDDRRMMASSESGAEEQWVIEATLVEYASERKRGDPELIVVNVDPYVRCAISLFGKVVADVGVYNSNYYWDDEGLWDEAQAVSAAILWSAIRGYRRDKGAA